MWRAMQQTEAMLEIDPSTLGTLEVDGFWVPYLDLYDVDFLPTRLKMVNDEYAFKNSVPRSGHGAILPQELRELRAEGKRAIIVEREDRYYVFVSPP